MPKKGDIRWTKARCAEEAAPYSTRNAFKFGCAPAYRASIRQGWLEEVCAHMPVVAPRPNYRWPRERVMMIASRYDDVLSFYQNEPSAYHAARLQGIFDEAVAHMGRRPFKKPQTWTKHACAIAAKKCKTRNEFRHRFSSAYVVSKRHGWIDEICSHMKKPKTGLNMRAIYVIRQSGTRRIYIGLSFSPKHRYRGHLFQPSKAVREIVEGPHSFKIISKLMPVEDAARTEQAAIIHFRNKGWNVTNLKRGGEVGSVRRKWTRARIESAAADCVSRMEMVRRFRGAYAAASKLGIIDDLFARHPNRGFLRTS